MSKKDFMNDHFHEYSFYKAFTRVNEYLRENGLNMITSSMGRNLRTSLSILTNDAHLSNIKKGDFTNFVNKIFEEKYGFKDAVTGDDYMSDLKEFQSYTGESSKVGNVSQNENTVLPISPFDPKHSNKGTVLRNGIDLLFVKYDKDDYENVPDAFYKEDINKDKLVKAGEYESIDDLSGMSRLSKYINRKEYSKLSNWVNGVGRENFMSSDALNRTTALLDYMDNNGIDYEIKPDNIAGQLKAELNNKMSIRIIDTKENEQYIGRVYNDGHSIYYITNQRSNTGDKKAVGYVPDIDETIDLLKFALGEKVGDIDSLTYDTKKGKAHSAYHTSAGAYTASIKDFDSNLGTKVQIHVDNSRSRNSKFFKDEIDAETYLREAVTTARENLYNMIDVDEILREIDVYRQDNDHKVLFVGESGISNLRYDYYNDAIKSDKDLIDLKLELEQRRLDDVDTIIGNYDVDADGKRFDIAKVAMYMSSDSGVPRNNDSIVTAMRMIGIDQEEIKANDFNSKLLQDRLIRFDETTAYNMLESDNAFIKSMGETVKETISSTGAIVDDKDILIDANGIVQYKATKVFNATPKKDGSSYKELTGYVGQVFTPDKNGLTTTKYAGSDNYSFVAGYEAYIIPDSGEGKSLEERTRLKGYEQIMSDSIKFQIRNDMLSKDLIVGEPTSVNKTYGRLYEIRYDIDEAKRSLEVDGLDKDLFEAKIATNARRVRYSNDIKTGSTTHADFMNRNSENTVDLNDNFKNAYKLTGYRNIAVLDDKSAGYFDSSLTATSTNQGTVRYLVESAVVNKDGSITQGSLDDKTPLMKHEIFKYDEFNSPDRNLMASTQVLTARKIAKDVGTAQMTFGGWTYEDGYVVSKEFAEANAIRGKGDEIRPLKVGDKISDLNGNKGVISLIVDRDMSLDEARELDLEQEVKIFKENPNLDVVGSPYYGVSRFNGGAYRSLSEKPEALEINGESVQGALGYTNYIITDMPVDEKTKIYSDEEVAIGKGRKASGQLAWALNSRGCTEILTDFYSSNNMGSLNMREYLNVCGLDVDNKGNLIEGYEPHVGEQRNIFKLPELEYRETKDGKMILNMPKLKNEFKNVIAERGGFLELPFELEFPTGDTLDIIGVNEKGENMYGLPILSSHLRSNQEFQDGSLVSHDYTNHYAIVYENALKYKDLKENGDKDSPDYQKNLDEFVSTAQSHYNRITDDVKMRRLEGKHNVFRQDMMRNNLSNSATAVWTADPRLDLGQVGYSNEMAENAGVKTGDHVIIWRDPMLREKGIMALEVVIDDRLTAMSINPATAKQMDGDFDGDSAGNKGNLKGKVKAEAIDKLGIRNNILDYGLENIDEKTGKKVLGLAINDGLDVKSYENAHPEKLIEKKELLEKANEEVAKNGKVSEETYYGINEYIKVSMRDNFGMNIIRFDSPQSHLESVNEMVLSGAKGSPKKLKSYADYLGFEYETNADGTIKENSVVDTGKTKATEADKTGVWEATAIKSFGTGIGGTFSIKGMMALRNYAPTSVLECTYPVTQSILQAKHDPVDAKIKYNACMSVAKHLWDGHKLDKEIDEKTGVETWKPVKDKDGLYIQATKDEFINQFMDVYDSKYGLGVGVPKSHVENIANILEDKKTGKVMGIEAFAEEYASPLDKLAYGNKGFDAIKMMAKDNVNVFDGKYNEYFMPADMYKNKQGLQNIAIVKKDAIVDKKVENAKIVQTHKYQSHVANTAEFYNKDKTNDCIEL